MIEAIDILFSNWIYMTIVIMIVMFVCIGLSFKNPFQNKNLNRAYKISMYVLSGGIMFVMQFTYFGRAHGFKQIYVSTNTICLLEEYDRGGDGPPETVCRLHIIERSSGKKKERMYLGSSGKIAGVRNDTICYLKDEETILYNATESKEIYRIEKEDWPSLFPELKPGVESIYPNNNTDAIILPLLQLNSKNGKQFRFEPFSKKIIKKDPDNIYIPEFSNSPYELTIKYSASSQKTFIKSEYLNGKLKRITQAGYNTKQIITDSTGFIEPYFLAIDTVNNFYIFRHYTTTDQDNYFIEAKDFAFKTLWKKSGDDPGASDSYNKPKISVWKFTEGVLYFNSGGFLIAMDPKSGNVIWSSRL